MTTNRAAESRPVVVLVGQTPPPREGQAIMIEALVNGLEGRIERIPIRMAYSDSVAEAGSFAWRKVRHLFALVHRTRAALRAHPGAVLYYPPAPARPMAVLRDIAFLSLTRRCAGATVFHFHASGLSSYLRRFGPFGRLARLAYRGAAAAIVQGPDGAADGEWLGAKRVVVLPYGRAVPIVPRARAAGRFRILFVGIHRRTKGIFDALLTLAELRRRGVDAELAAAGAWFSEEERRAAARLVEREDLADRVLWLGVLEGDALWQAYADADALLFPTFYPWESQGLVAVEAMAYALPVVASDWKGPRDVVIDGQTGYLRPVHDVAGFAEALARLSGDAALRRTLGMAGRRRYEALYRPEPYMEHMAELLREAATRTVDDKRRLRLVIPPKLSR